MQKKRALGENVQIKNCEASDSKEMSEESFYLGAVSNKNETEEANWTVSLKIGDTPVTLI